MILLTVTRKKRSMPHLLRYLTSRAKVLLASIVISLFLYSHVHPYSYPISLQERVDNAAFIFEGKVVSKFSFWNEKHTNIYTSNTIEIYKLFKGDLNSSEVQLITRGGHVGTEFEIVSDVLRLNVGDIGMFLCKVVNAGMPKGELLRLRAYGGEQGFIRYDILDNVATDGFRTFKNIPDTLYSEIISFTGENYRQIKAIEFLSYSEYAPLSATSITDFNPKSVPAGTGEQLTIYGSGFGNDQGSGVVWFRNADRGGLSLTAFAPGWPAYLSWSDTEIILHLSDSAGTGPLIVENDSEERVESDETLNVPFAIIGNWFYGGSAILPLLSNYNGKGGYTFQMNTEFAANSDAGDTVLNAINKYKCETGANWENGETTTVDENIRDGVNVIRFSNSGELGGWTLGSTTSRFNINIYGSRVYLVEIDMVFNSDTDWYLGEGSPGPDQIDFQSVVLHEFGHAIMLGHVNDSNELMYYALGSGGIRRELSDNLRDGVNYVLDYSEAKLTSPMIRARLIECPTLADVINVLKVLAGLDVDDPCPFTDYDCESGIGLKEAAYMLQKMVGLRE
jgi:hypothetical protein